jgi:hypothetical protein
MVNKNPFKITCNECGHSWYEYELGAGATDCPKCNDPKVLKKRIDDLEREIKSWKKRESNRIF